MCSSDLAVVVIDPAAVEREFGWRQLYVVLTRSTTNLGLVTDAAAPGDDTWLDASA